MAATQGANFSAAVWTFYPVDVSGGNVTATLPDLTTLTGGEEIAFAIVSGGNDLVLAAAGGGQQVRVKADVAASVALNVGVLIYGAVLIADQANSSWTAKSTS